MKRLTIAFIFLLLGVLSCLANPLVVATPTENFPVAIECTLQYTITVHCQGTYNPGSTRIRIELTDIPTQTGHQQVEATLQQGSIENIDGQETWVIETTEIYTTIHFTGTFTVRENIGNTLAVPHQPLTPVSGMEEYLLPDNYVTLSPSVRNQAQQLVSETENDVPKIIAKFVDWIRKNITYNIEVGYESRLTDSQVLSLRAGVCDEFSTLFIAFCRAVGIPARRVLGFGPITENDINKNIEKAGHSWAEVWIPSYGWLTVDPTWADIGNVSRISTARGYDESVLRWQWFNAPPSFKITDATYSVTLTNWNIIETAPSVTLMKEETENEWKITVRNDSFIPLLDNVLVKKAVFENWELSEWSVFSNEIIFMNPQENYTFSLEKEDGVAYLVWTRMADNSVSMWQYPSGTQTPTPTPTPTPTTTPSPTPTITPTLTPTTPPPEEPADTAWIWVSVISAVAIVVALIAVIIVLRK